MPVEIKELVVRAVVHKGGPKSDGEGEGGQVSEEDKAALLQAVVKEVLKILRHGKER